MQNRFANSQALMKTQVRSAHGCVTHVSHLSGVRRVIFALVMVAGCTHEERALAKPANLALATAGHHASKLARAAAPRRSRPAPDSAPDPVATAAGTADVAPRARHHAKPAASSQNSSPTPVPLDLLAGAIEPIHADDPTLPDQLLYSARGKVLEGSYKICIARDGKVQSVTPVVGIAGADRGVVATLKTWQFPKLPVTLCKLQTLRFEVQ